MQKETMSESIYTEIKTDPQPLPSNSGEGQSVLLSSDVKLDKSMALTFKLPMTKTITPQPSTTLNQVATQNHAWRLSFKPVVPTVNTQLTANINNNFAYQGTGDGQNRVNGGLNSLLRIHASASSQSASHSQISETQTAVLKLDNKKMRSVIIPHDDVPTEQVLKAAFDTKVPGTSVEYKTPGANGLNKSGNIKRPMNAFMCWARTERQKLCESMPNASNSDISVALGRIWCELPPEKKQEYYNEAETIKRKHRQEYPGWSYRPKPKRRLDSLGKPSLYQQWKMDQEVKRRRTEIDYYPKYAFISQPSWSKPQIITSPSTPNKLLTYNLALPKAGSLVNQSPRPATEICYFQSNIHSTTSIPAASTTVLSPQYKHVKPVVMKSQHMVSVPQSQQMTGIGHYQLKPMNSGTISKQEPVTMQTYITSFGSSDTPQFKIIQSNENKAQEPPTVSSVSRAVAVSPNTVKPTLTLTEEPVNSSTSALPPFKVFQSKVLPDTEGIFNSYTDKGTITCTSSHQTDCANKLDISPLKSQNSDIHKSENVNLVKPKLIGTAKSQCIPTAKSQSIGPVKLQSVTTAVPQSVGAVKFQNIAPAPPKIVDINTPTGTIGKTTLQFHSMENPLGRITPHKIIKEPFSKAQRMNFNKQQSPIFDYRFGRNTPQRIGNQPVRCISNTSPQNLFLSKPFAIGTARPYSSDIKPFKSVNMVGPKSFATSIVPPLNKTNTIVAPSGNYCKFISHQYQDEPLDLSKVPPVPEEDNITYESVSVMEVCDSDTIAGDMDVGCNIEVQDEMEKFCTPETDILETENAVASIMVDQIGDNVTVDTEENPNSINPLDVSVCELQIDTSIDENNNSIVQENDQTNVNNDKNEETKSQLSIASPNRILECSDIIVNLPNIEDDHVFPFKLYPYSEKIKQEAEQANERGDAFPQPDEVAANEIALDLTEAESDYDEDIPKCLPFSSDNLQSSGWRRRSPDINLPPLDMTRWVNYMNEVSPENNQVTTASVDRNTNNSSPASETEHVSEIEQFVETPKTTKAVERSDEKDKAKTCMEVPDKNHLDSNGLAFAVNDSSKDSIPLNCKEEKSTSRKNFKKDNRKQDLVQKKNARPKKVKNSNTEQNSESKHDVENERFRAFLKDIVPGCTVHNIGGTRVLWPQSAGPWPLDKIQSSESTRVEKKNNNKKTKSKKKVKFV